MFGAQKVDQSFRKRLEHTPEKGGRSKRGKAWAWAGGCGLSPTGSAWGRPVGPRAAPLPACLQPPLPQRRVKHPHCTRLSAKSWGTRPREGGPTLRGLTVCGVLTCTRPLEHAKCLGRCKDRVGQGPGGAGSSFCPGRKVKASKQRGKWFES